MTSLAMNSGKQVMRYDISSDEESDDHQEEAQDDTTTCGTKRSYECTFCKRGFTNAQALGGHMNIHRKDRAKAAKQVSSSNKFTNEEPAVMAPPFASSGFSNHTTRNYSILESHQRNNCDMYFHPPPPPNNLVRNQPSYALSLQFDHHQFHNPIRSSARTMNFNQELRGANLSLQIGPSHVDSNNQKDNEIDLELRLGHDYPY
ncbi:hypothetical protein RIF29_21513 [Crotalaria pallida]|uniref:C2H2-type domain-containing protein n=1 Tax=Crotalaria pallida TaxID=3830 RepID=A0AAN9F4W3_CROPI